MEAYDALSRHGFKFTTC